MTSGRLSRDVTLTSFQAYVEIHNFVTEGCVNLRCCISAECFPLILSAQGLDKCGSEHNQRCFINRNCGFSWGLFRQVRQRFAKRQNPEPTEAWLTSLPGGQEHSLRAFRLVALRFAVLGRGTSKATFAPEMLRSLTSLRIDFALSGFSVSQIWRRGAERKGRSRGTSISECHYYDCNSNSCSSANHE